MDKFILRTHFGSRLLYKKVSGKNSPEVLDSVKRVSSFFGIEMPTVYINHLPEFFALSLKKSKIIIISQDILPMLKASELDALLAHEMAHLQQRHSIFLRQKRNLEADRYSIEVAGYDSYLSLYQKLDRLKIASELPERSSAIVQALVDTNPDCFYEKKQSLLVKLTAEHPGRVKRLNAAADYWREKIAQNQEVREKAEKMRSLSIVCSGLLTLVA